VLALKNKVCPEFTVLNIYFLSFRILNKLRLPWKTEFALKFFTVLKYFLSFRIFEQLELALKTEFALNYSSRWGGRSARPPASYATACPLIKNKDFVSTFSHSNFLFAGLDGQPDEYFWPFVPIEGVVDPEGPTALGAQKLEANQIYCGLFQVGISLYFCRE